MVARGVVNLEVEVAVLDLVGNLSTGADSCFVQVVVEYDGECRPVRGETDFGCPRLTTGTAVGHSRDSNLARVGFIIRSGCCGVEGGEEAKNDSGDGVLHSKGFKKKI